MVTLDVEKHKTDNGSRVKKRCLAFKNMSEKEERERKAAIIVEHFGVSKLLQLGSISLPSLKKLLHDDPGIPFSIPTTNFSKLRELIATKLGEINPAIILTKKGQKYYFVEESREQ